MRLWSAASVFLLLGPSSPALASPPPPPERPAARALAASAVELFSKRARRRAATLLRLRWEELRLQDFERARAAIRRQIPVDALLREAGQPAAGAKR